MATVKKTTAKKKAPVKKTVAKKAAPKRKAPVKKAAAKKSTPKRKSTVKKLSNTRTTTRKQTNVQKLRAITLDERLDANAKDAFVKLRHVDVTFGHGKKAVRAMRNMSLNIKKGEVLGLVGESGSGKSTTGNAILGLLDRAAGSISVADIDIPKQESKIRGQLKNRLVNKAQMIFQDPASSLNPHKNIESIITEGLNNIKLKWPYLKDFAEKTITNSAVLEGKKVNPNDLARIKEITEAKDQKEYASYLFETFAKKIKKPKTKAYIEIRELEYNRLVAGANGMKAMKKRLAIRTLKQVGLTPDVLKRYPLEFSGGQQQRVGITRAISMRPELIVADEPISALDVSIQAQVINMLNNMKDEYNLTILFIAHDLRMVEYISDRIAVMYRGVLVEIGKTSEIVNNPIHPYTKLLLSAIPSIDASHEDLTEQSQFYSNQLKQLDDEPNCVWWKVEGDEDHNVFLSEGDSYVVNNEIRQVDTESKSEGKGNDSNETLVEGLEEDAVAEGGTNV